MHKYKVHVQVRILYWDLERDAKVSELDLEFRFFIIGYFCSNS